MMAQLTLFWLYGGAKGYALTFPQSNEMQDNTQSCCGATASATDPGQTHIPRVNR